MTKGWDWLRFGPSIKPQFIPDGYGARVGGRGVTPLHTPPYGDPHVRLVVMFGRGRFSPGDIIYPKPAFAFDPEDQNSGIGFGTLVTVFLSPTKVSDQGP